MGRSVQKRPLEAMDSQYVGIPICVLDSAAWMEASHTAKALLFELMRQHNGRNNGHLQLSSAWLERRGWTSRSVVQRARATLIDRKLIILTKTGGLNAGASQYAVTWLPISNFIGLDIQSKNYHKGAYTHMNPIPPPKIAKSVPLEGTVSTVSGYSTVPFKGTAEIVTVP